MSLRNLPYTAMSIIEITALDDVNIVPINYIETPNHISDVRNLYAEIDRPHVLIPLMSSVGFSPGKKKVAASTSFYFPRKTRAWTQDYPRGLGLQYALDEV